MRIEEDLVTDKEMNESTVEAEKIIDKIYKAAGKKDKSPLTTMDFLFNDLAIQLLQSGYTAKELKEMVTVSDVLVKKWAGETVCG